MAGCLELARAARAAGVTVPIVFMGYLNPMLAYGFEKLAKESKESGVDGFIIVDLPAEAAHDIIGCGAIWHIPIPIPPAVRMVQVSFARRPCCACPSLLGLRPSAPCPPPFLVSVLAALGNHLRFAGPPFWGFGLARWDHLRSVTPSRATLVVFIHMFYFPRGAA